MPHRLTKPFNKLFDGVGRFFEIIYGIETKDFEIEKVSSFKIFPESLNYDKASFIYDNGINYMLGIESHFKIINARAILLLSYLAALLAALAILVFQYPYPNSHDMVSALDRIIISFSAITIFFYLGLVFVIARNLVSPSFGYPVYNEPKNIMEEKMVNNDMKLIKFFEAELLQTRISYNINMRNMYSENLKKCISATFIIPVAVLLFVTIIEAFIPMLLETIFHFLYSWLLT